MTNFSAIKKKLKQAKKSVVKFYCRNKGDIDKYSGAVLDVLDVWDTKILPKPFLYGLKTVKTLTRLIYTEEDEDIDKIMKDTYDCPFHFFNSLEDRVLFNSIKDMDSFHLKNCYKSAQETQVFKIDHEKFEKDFLLYVCINEQNGMVELYHNDLLQFKNLARLIWGDSFCLELSIDNDNHSSPIYAFDSKKGVKEKTIGGGVNDKRLLPLEKPEMDWYVSFEGPDKFLDKIKLYEEKSMKKSTIFYGPPRSGKTSFVFLLKEKIRNKSLLKIKGNLISSYHLYSIINIISLLEPGIVLLDDFDLSISGNSTAELLFFFERLNSLEKTLVIATINNLSLLPPALISPGRFDEIVEFPAPTKEHRCLILKSYGNKYGFRLSNTKLNKLATMTEGMTGGFLKEIMREAYILPFNEVVDRINLIRKLNFGKEDYEGGEF